MECIKKRGRGGGRGGSGLTRVKRQAPVRASQSLMVLSREPVITKGPRDPVLGFCVKRVGVK